MKTLATLLVALCLVVGLSGAANAVVHSVQIMDDFDQPLVGVDVTINVFTIWGWREYNVVTDASGTASTPDVPLNINANDWDYDVPPGQGYDGPDPLNAIVDYPTISVLLDQY